MDYLNKILAWIARNLKKGIALVAVVVCIALATMFAYDLAYNFIRKDENVAYDSDGEKVTLTIQKARSVKRSRSFWRRKASLRIPWHFV
ncbi:MAG: hypothetical protein ACLTDS_10225 [Bianqueaceae bacterium]